MKVLFWSRTKQLSEIGDTRADGKSCEGLLLGFIIMHELKTARGKYAN